MTEEIAYNNGQFVPAEQLVVDPQDTGFVLGVTVAEQLRTFRGELGDVDLHFERLRSSLKTIGVADLQISDLTEATRKVAAHNHALLETGHDLGVTVFVTPGLYPTYYPDRQPEPTIGIHTYPLPFSLWADKYKSGQACEIVSVPQVGERCWPRDLKCRSRMHYFLADREAQKKNEAARAILLDAQRNVNEASTANVLAYFKSEGIVSPPLASILPGVTLRRTEQIANSIGLAFEYRTLTCEELRNADEIILTSTPFCVLPVSLLGDRMLDRRDCYNRLLEAWNEEVGLDLQAQAKRHVMPKR